MDQDILVKSGHLLIEKLEAKGLKIGGAMWVHNTDIDTWRLWLVPTKKMKDERDFYRRVVETIRENQGEMRGLDASDTELVSPNHPAIKALSRLFKLTGKSSMHLSNNKLDDFYLTDGIVLQMDL